MTIEHLRELDAWIAENVMGWVWWKFDTKFRKDIPKPHEWCGLVRHEENWPKTLWKAKRLKSPIAGMEQDKDVPNYTTDPAAAMEVLRKCILKNESCGFEKDSHGWLCGKIYWNDQMICDSEYAETLELAIALFAKKLFSK